VNHHASPRAYRRVLADDLKTVEAGKLTWGSSPTFKPFEFMRDGKAQGFDVD
jgi:ABC-type amino acid transport substrate-binding protein